MLQNIGARLEQTEVVIDIPRSSSEHGVVIASVHWARHTLAFEQLAPWCAVEMSSTAATRLLLYTWRIIGRTIARVVADLDSEELLEGVGRIGINEISYRSRHRFLLVVVDHDRRRLIHAVNGAHAISLGGFFDLLGEEGTTAISNCQRPSAVNLFDPLFSNGGCDDEAVAEYLESSRALHFT